MGITFPVATPRGRSSSSHGGNVSGYVCNHGSPNGERDTASPRLWAMLRTQASDEEADDVFSRRHLYCGTPVVTSWAVACQQVVFLHMYLQTRVTLRAFPVATPRGRSVSFPIRGTMVTYVTWDVSLLLNWMWNCTELYLFPVLSLNQLIRLNPILTIYNHFHHAAKTSCLLIRDPVKHSVDVWGFKHFLRDRMRTGQTIE